MTSGRATETTIRLKAVTKSFGETHALRGVDFDARAGEVHAIVGENGSGKSTLAKIMSGVLLADSGEVTVLGTTPLTPIAARKTGLATIFQEILVADEASVYDNLYVGRDSLFRATASRSESEAEASALMERFVGSVIDISAPVGGLPLNVKQWIVIARAILRQPKVLILDESSAALDLEATLRLHTEISRLRAAGSTILIVTHRIAELVRIADRATVLRDGQAVGVLEKADITEANLLAMMTPQDRQLAMISSFARKTGDTAPKTVLTAKALAPVRGAMPFDFNLEAGQIIGVTGLDGQGQHDFLLALAGVQRSQAGVVVMDGKPLASLADAERLGIAYVSGDRKREGIFPDLSIFENLAMGIYRQHTGPLGIIKRSQIEPLFRAEVERLRIKCGRISNKITSLSGGNQQKVLIGRAFARNPRVIVLNDPARGVDLGTKRDLYLELRRFAEAGSAVVYLSSEIEEFLGFADRVDVFVANTVFRSLSGAEISEEEILAAMFGQAAHTELSFKTEEVA